MLGRLTKRVLRGSLMVAVKGSGTYVIAKVDMVAHNLITVGNEGCGLLKDQKRLHEGSMALLGLVQISLLGDPIEVRQEEFRMSKLTSDIHRMA
jgi:hypothetical protein